jgi:hypothetical protein
MENLEVGKVYNVQWMPTKYMYERTGTLLRINDTGIDLDVDKEHFVRIQFKHIKGITPTP